MDNGRYSPYSTPSATREVLERHGLFTKYALGQNFLVNDDVIRKIVELADVQLTDRILEVGPGIGTLTAALLPRAAHVAAIEKDADLPAVLADTLAPWADKFTLIQADALDYACELGEPGDRGIPGDRDDNPEADSGPWGSCSGGQQATAAFSAAECNKLVSNLPYAVAATVVLDYLQRFESLESMTVMVQKEVADRMMAEPGTKAYGAYTVKLRLYARPAGRFSVAPGNFFPPPHVESSVLRLDRADAPASVGAICTMADAAFATRRKTIANSCKAFFANDPAMQARLPEVFERASIDPRRRGETLSLEEFCRLGSALAEGA